MLPSIQTWVAAKTLPLPSIHNSSFRLSVALLVLCQLIISTAAAQVDRSSEPEWIRGAGKSLEMLLSGRLQSVDGASVGQAAVEVKIKYNSRIFETQQLEVDNGRFSVWLPVGKYRWYSIIIDAKCEDGARGSRTIVRQQLRQLVKDGLVMQVVRPTEEVEFRLEHQGKPVAEAKVKITLQNGTVLWSQSDAQGVAQVQLIDHEQIDRVAAWGNSSLIGGISQKSNWQDLPSKELPMYRCRTYVIQVKDTDQQPIVNARLRAYGYSEERNFFFPPDEFELVTDESGQAVFPWLPDLENLRTHVSFLDEQWHISERVPSEDEYQLTGKRAAGRHLITGNVTGGSEFVGGFAIKLGSFQHEEEGRIDFAYAMTNSDGSFSAEVLPDATYAVFLEDDQWVSKAVDLVAYESDIKQKRSPVLMLAKGVPVRIKLTQGSAERPMPHTFMNINSNHSFSWMENGGRRSGSLGRNSNDSTNQQGILDIVAPEGPLEVSVYLDDWRGSKEIEVQRGQRNEVHIHRKVDEAVPFTGQIIPPDGADTQVANLQVHIKGIDGESGDDFKVKTDASGKFEVNTTATKLGAIVFTDDKKFAGSLAVKDLTSTAKIQLYPTKSYSGQIIDPDGQPVANHNVWASIKVKDKREFGTPYPTVFYTRLSQKTDATGKFQLDGLPCKAEILLGTDTLDLKPSEFSLIDEVYFLPTDEDRSKIKTIGDTAANSAPKQIKQLYEEKLRDCRLNDFHLMVMIHDSSNKSHSEFINRHLMDYAKQPAVSTFMQLKIDKAELEKAVHKDFIANLDWDSSTGVKAVVYSGEGKVLGRQDFDPAEDASSGLAFRFVEDLQPQAKDALAKWENASKIAAKENKLVWIRTGSRYCGPCFRLSRWLDDHKEVLEKDFVLVKVDTRDINGIEVADSLSDGRSVGVPFHAIFTPDKERVTDSYGPIGNIGFMSGLEGKRHFKKMMRLARKRITEAELQQLLDSLSD